MTLEQALDTLSRLAEQVPLDTPLYTEYEAPIIGLEPGSVTLYDPETGTDLNITAVIVETDE